MEELERARIRVYFLASNSKKQKSYSFPPAEKKKPISVEVFWDFSVEPHLPAHVQNACPRLRIGLGGVSKVVR